MGDLSPWHLLILAGVIVLLFGSKKLPDAARAIGRSLRIFKAETRGLREDDAAHAEAKADPVAVVTPAVSAAPAAAEPVVLAKAGQPDEAAAQRG